MTNDEEGDKTGEVKERKKLLDTIRLPLVSIFPKKRTDSNLGNQSAQAGLASMETLEDKSTDEKNTDELKNVPLEPTKTDVEKQEEVEEQTWKQKLMAYRVAISAFLIFLLLILIIVIAAIPETPVIRVAPIREGRYVEAVTSCGKVEG